MTWRGWTVGIIVTALAGGVWSFSNRRGGGTEGEFLQMAAEVMRGDLPISVVERGNLKAANSIELKSEIEGNTTILMLIEEGKMVLEGDLLCELDATDMLEQRVSQEITVQNAEASLIKSTQILEIQKSQNESDLAAALRKFEFAKIDLRIYTEGDWPNKRQAAEDDILLSKEQGERAKTKLIYSEKLFESGFITRTDFEADKLAKKSSEINLEQAERTLRVLETHTNPRELMALGADVVEAEREIERVKLESAARLVDYEADLRSSRAKRDLELEQYQRLGDQIAKAKIYAPAAGMVVYAQPEGGRSGSGEPLREGSNVRERQKIVTIPSSEGMIAEVSLHESVLERVQVGMPCTVKVDALGDLELTGRVKFKAVLPDRNSWMANPNQRLYRTEIAILDSDSRMRPGMSCSIEIHVEVVRDTLYVPVQSIFRDGGESIVFVYPPNKPVAKRGVEVGSFSHLWAQVSEGLDEGERISLSVPLGQALAPAPTIEAKLLEGFDEYEWPESGEVPNAEGLGASPSFGPGGAQSPGGGAPGRDSGQWSPSGGGDRTHQGNSGEKKGGRPGKNPATSGEKGSEAPMSQESSNGESAKPTASPSGELAAKAGEATLEDPIGEKPKKADPAANVDGAGTQK